jgi:Mrp family chromosome partitioning ATPase
MGSMLQELREQFNLVLLDAPPVLPVTDAAIIGSRSDGVILVVEYGATTREQIHHSLERLEAAKATVLGVVVNRSPMTKRTNGYGYGYGYGYRAEAKSGLRVKAGRRWPWRSTGRG